MTVNFLWLSSMAAKLARGRGKKKQGRGPASSSYAQSVHDSPFPLRPRPVTATFSTVECHVDQVTHVGAVRPCQAVGRGCIALLAVDATQLGEDSALGDTIQP